MKLPLTCLALFAAASLVSAADPAPASPAATKPELRGVMDLGDAKRFLLASPGGAENKWESLGDTFGTWKVAEYRDKDRTLVLHGDDGKELDLSLAASPATGEDPKATLADAEAVLRKMDFSKMMAKVIEQQKLAMANMSRQMAASMKLKDVDPQAMADYQKKVMDLVMDSIDPKQLEADTAAIYSDVFTKTQLDGLADFYDSSAGQAYLDKQPEIQQRMQQVMMPRIMAVVPRIQAMAQDFAKQQRAAAAAAGGGGTPPPAQP